MGKSASQVEKFWSDAIDCMYSACVMGLNITNVTGTILAKDYVLEISCEVRDSDGVPGEEDYTSEIGTITKIGDVITMKIGEVFDEDISHVFTDDDPGETGESLTHCLDDVLF